MGRSRRSHQSGDESTAKGPSHERHRRRRKRKMEREQALRDAWVSEVWGKRGHGACGRKVRFRCMHDAGVFVADHHLTRTAWAYRCPYCNGWHLTSHPEENSVRLDATRVRR